MKKTAKRRMTTMKKCEKDKKYKNFSVKIIQLHLNTSVLSL